MAGDEKAYAYRESLGYRSLMGRFVGAALVVLAACGANDAGEGCGDTLRQSPDAGPDYGDGGLVDTYVIEECVTAATQAPCGGDPVGSWSQLARCEYSVCGATLATRRSFALLDIRSDGTYSVDDDGSESRQYVVVDSACCEVDDSCEQAIWDRCEGDLCSNGCQCRREYTGEDVSHTGTWTSADTSITFTSDGGDSIDAEAFCVEGDRLLLDLAEGDTAIYQRINSLEAS